jgi:hypothetical protein
LCCIYGGVSSTAAHKFYLQNFLLYLRLFLFRFSSEFQAFFVSYLVEPMYKKKLETLDELLQSDVVYNIHQIISFVKEYANISEFSDFVEQKRLKEDCSDLRKCVERMITKETLLLLLLHFLLLMLLGIWGLLMWVK